MEEKDNKLAPEEEEAKAAEPEKKIEEAEDDDFADSVKFAPAKEEAKPEEKKEPSPAPIDVHKQLEEGESAEKVEPSKRDAKGDVEYDDERFAKIEKARKKFVKIAKKWSYWRAGIIGIGITAVLIGWLVPQFAIKDAGKLPLYLGLAFAVATAVAVIVYGIFQRKAREAAQLEYMRLYTDQTDGYLYDGLGANDVKGKMEDKLSTEEFKATDMYGACSRHDGELNVGSRDMRTFAYGEMDCTVCDCAAEARTEKGMMTVFVGKLLTTTNHLDVKDGGLYVYVKGGPRSTPPSFLYQKEVECLEDNKRYCIFGNKENKKLITKELRQGIASIHTDNLLIDVAISFKSGKTYWALGYEDTLMMFQIDKPFDPAYLKRYKEDLKKFLDLAAKL